MKKISIKPGTMLYPLPAVMVSCGTMEESNIVTIAWTGIINSEPPYTYISVRPRRHSNSIIRRDMEFVLNLTTKDLAYETDHCGCVSGTKEDKFETMKLTKIKGDVVNCPMIEECPVNIECKVIEIKELPSHDMFMAEIVAVHVNAELLDEKGRIALEKGGLMAFVHSDYVATSSRSLGRMGFSVMKAKTKKRILKEGGKVIGTKAKDRSKQLEEKKTSSVKVSKTGKGKK